VKEKAENAAPRDWVNEQFADKTSTKLQQFLGPLEATSGISVKSGKRAIGLFIDYKTGRTVIGHGDGNQWAEISLPTESGKLALAGDSYTRAETDRIYQPIGSYATNSSLNALKTQSGAGWVRDPTTGVVTQWGAFRTVDGAGYVDFPRKLTSEIYFIGITVQGGASNQVGYSNETLSGMRITRGAGDAQDRIGRWLVIGV
jgi:hypothetical protein